MPEDCCLPGDITVTRIHTGFLIGRAKGARSVAEVSAACVLMLSALYIVFNEGFANWQSLWVCAVLAALAFNLALARDAQS